MTRTASLILPAHNEGKGIGRCLSAVAQSSPLPSGWQLEVIVVANGCTDDTAQVAREHADTLRNRGWSLTVIELPQGGKLGALNAGDAQATGQVLLYLDADVTVSQDLISQTIRALDAKEPRYASGRPHVTTGAGFLTRAYTRFWLTLPFLQTGVPGFGFFAMNRPGRRRWVDWPDIISDDTFARLNFAPAERIGVTASYDWPMVEGLSNLVRVRRRQDEGVAEIEERFPQLLTNDDKTKLTIWGILARAIRHPVGFLSYALVSIAVRSPLYRSDEAWARGR